MADEGVTVDRTALQSVFDTAVHSLDFGSGFLDDEEVRHLRAIAVALGVDPMEATPRQFKCKYKGAHTPHTGDAFQCEHCYAKLPSPYTGDLK